MKVNVVITPKKNEVIECSIIICNNGVVELFKKSGRNTVAVAAFKKWIRYYILPEERLSLGKVKVGNK